MKKIDESILSFISAHPEARISQIEDHLEKKLSHTTVWRSLKRLLDEGKIHISGKGKASRYSLADSGIIRKYLITPYNQRKATDYNKKFLDAYIPNKTFYLNLDARQNLHARGKPDSALFPAGTYACRILEKLLIDLSWASSHLEGNTYNILDTEKLIRYGQEASGKDRSEAIMILNHKEAIQYLVDNLSHISISRADICNIHALLANGLLIDPAMGGRIRQFPVGISYSSYKPLTDRLDIEEEFHIIIQKAEAISDPFEQAFFILVHIPYLQAFEDVNKRTSRIVSNIPLLKAELAPMSFITMNEKDYIDGLIGIYELNDVSLLRDAYIEAYSTSAEHYRVFRAQVDNPDNAALMYRDFVREAVRKCVLEWKKFMPELVEKMAQEANIPTKDLEAVVNYVGREVQGLHEGNAIRYRLDARDLASLRKE